MVFKIYLIFLDDCRLVTKTSFCPVLFEPLAFDSFYVDLDQPDILSQQIIQQRHIAKEIEQIKNLSLGKNKNIFDDHLHVNVPCK